MIATTINYNLITKDIKDSNTPYGINLKFVQRAKSYNHACHPISRNGVVVEIILVKSQFN